MFDYERVFYCPSFVLMGLLLARMLPLGTLPPFPHGFLYVFCCCCLFLYTLNGLMERWKKRRMEKRTRRMINKMKTEIPEWQPANVEGLMEICIQ